MSVVPAPSGSARGEVRLQPSYFTSSLYVNPFREDVSQLVDAFGEQYLQSRTPQPFALFKSIWNTQGWSWIHLRVFDARAREAFLNVSARLFLEKTAAAEPPISRVVALFALYTFFWTQPDSSAPSIYAIKHVPIPIDHYNSLMTLPNVLTTEELKPLQPHVCFILSKVVDTQVFYILPSSDLHPEHPRHLPREIFCPTNQDLQSTAELPKKKGRPSRREKMLKAKDALKNLDKWLDNTSYVHPNADHDSSTPITTHILMSRPPATTRQHYQMQKSQLLASLAHEITAPDGQQVLQRANDAVVARLRKIDQMAAEQGLEVGGEGGERTGLERVERAAAELAAGGILGLLDGGGTGPCPDAPENNMS